MADSSGMAPTMQENPANESLEFVQHRVFWVSPAPGR
jgi:hypothetical protein